MGNDHADALGQAVLHLRRYARALTGSQETGDRYAAATLETILEDPDALKSARSPKVALFRVFHLVWSSAGAPLGQPDTRLDERSQLHMANLTPNSREALLLTTIEGFTAAEVGEVMECSSDEAAELVEIAFHEMEESIRGRVLIIEDEPIIALDLQAIVEEMGHAVTGNARTHAQAVAMASETPPDLVLADIQLADNSSGIDAVNDILARFPNVPAVFITAFPDRLLTGEKPEPAFLISKPYAEAQVRSAVSQAMFFASTQTLAA